MDYANPDALVSTDGLARHLDADVRIVDGSWHMPELNRDPRAEFEERHIPGAVFFDIDAIADAGSPLPHMLPDPETFARHTADLGLGDGAHIVVYDTTAVGSAARVWWTLRAFGHDRIAVLDGGLRKWLAEGRPVEAGAPAPEARATAPRFEPRLVRDLEAVRANIESGREQVLDARSAGRFTGTEPEPRPGLRSGHIPGSRNLPFLDLYNPETRTMKSGGELRELFEAVRIDVARPVITTCGSGVTACNLALALTLVGAREVAVYDGSWTEWGGRDDTPVET
jgi:thiosulfate/3-mercaptopyruvate sulfurtransferase